jgi:hypothetical protein
MSHGAAAVRDARWPEHRSDSDAWAGRPRDRQGAGRRMGSGGAAPAGTQPMARIMLEGTRDTEVTYCARCSRLMRYCSEPFGAVATRMSVT